MDNITYIFNELRQGYVARNPTNGYEAFGRTREEASSRLSMAIRAQNLTCFFEKSKKKRGSAKWFERFGEEEQEKADFG